MGTTMGRPQPSVVVLGTAALAAVVVLGSAVTGPWVITGRDASWSLFPDRPLPTMSAAPAPAPTSAPAPQPPVAAPAALVDAVRVLLVLVAAAVVAVMVALLVVLARRLRAALEQRAAAPEDLAAGAAVEGGSPDDAHLPRLRDGVAQAERHLHDDVPPGDAVIAAWVALERAAGRTGVDRDPAATPTEFTVAVLDATPVDPAAIRALLALYLAARFSAHELTAGDVQRARTSLRVLADGLARRAAARSGP
jgi:hypothetical protein